MRTRAGYHRLIPLAFCCTDRRIQTQRSCRCLRRTLIFLNIYNSLLCMQSKTGRGNRKCKSSSKFMCQGDAGCPSQEPVRQQRGANLWRRLVPQNQGGSQGRNLRWWSVQVWVWCGKTKAGEDEKMCESSVFPGSGAVSCYGVPKGTFPGISLKRQMYKVVPKQSLLLPCSILTK